MVLTPLSTIFQLYRGGFIGGGKMSIRKNPSAWRKSLTNFIILYVVSSTPRLSGIRTHNFSGDRH
jgi:hypothetical protein